ncbi:ABC transporter permease subunit [Phytohabitans rumicis]|uniref:ABC transporter permease subunit n=1 Tax=Phytohabitans rumicis TaxID=1076125 RepID=UPI001C4994AD|nr:ABC transporter permease subunit [Phytohabitans rumicis]
MRAELTKIRTVRSTVWTLLLAVALSVGLAYLLGLSWRNAYDRLENFDPLVAGFMPLTLGQLPLVVFGALTVTSEYSTGTIRASLAAVPDRARFYAGKVLAGTLVAAVVAVVTVPVTFVVAQAGLGPYGTSLGADGVVPALVGACLYLTLMCAFAIGVAAALRHTALVLGILLPVLFLGSQGLGNIPAIKAVTQYLPDQTGWVVMHLAGPQDDPRWARDYGAWTGLALLALWAAAALAAGYLSLRRRDA